MHVIEADQPPAIRCMERDRLRQTTRRFAITSSRLTSNLIQQPSSG